MNKWLRNEIYKCLSGTQKINSFSRGCEVKDYHKNGCFLDAHFYTCKSTCREDRCNHGNLLSLALGKSNMATDTVNKLSNRNESMKKRKIIQYKTNRINDVVNSPGAKKKYFPEYRKNKRRNSSVKLICNKYFILLSIIISCKLQWIYMWYLNYFIISLALPQGVYV